MRFRILATLSLLAFAPAVLPHAGLAATPREAWESRMTVLTRVSANAPVCAIIGYTVDGDGATAAFTKEMADAPKAGLTTTQAETFVVTKMAMANAEVETYTANFGHADDDIATRAYKTAFEHRAPVCKQLSEASPFMKPGLFQASGRPQTFGDFWEFRADTGTADDMMRAVDFYETGYIPDPGHVKQLALTRRAAEKRHPKAAFYLASYYIAGDSVEPSNEKAVMWLIIGDALGSADASEYLAGFQAKLSAAEAAHAEADAKAWLKAHPAS